MLPSVNRVLNQRTRGAALYRRSRVPAVYGRGYSKASDPASTATHMRLQWVLAARDIERPHFMTGVRG